MSLGRASHSDRPVRFPRSLLQLVTLSSKKTIGLAVAAIAVTWLPPACLSALGGRDSFFSFLSDYAAQSRMLFAIPLLILGEPPMVRLLEMIANHFREERVVKTGDLQPFQSALKYFEEGDSLLIRIIMALAVVVTASAAFPLAYSAPLLPWCHPFGSASALSAAGSWYIAVSHSILCFMLFRWLWRQLLWLWFLAVVSRLDLQLVPAHPDRSAGLSFLEISLRGFVPFALAIGTIAAGGIANRAVYFHRALQTFRYLPFVVALIVALLCVAPLCVFSSVLLRARERGIFQYGGLAMNLGRHFEKKWLAAPDETPAQCLEAPDFSATIDLYSIVANVHEMNLVPFGLKSVGSLLAISLLPLIPVVFAVLPLNVLAKDVMKFLL